MTFERKCSAGVCRRLQGHCRQWHTNLGLEGSERELHVVTTWLDVICYLCLVGGDFHDMVEENS